MLFLPLANILLALLALPDCVGDVVDDLSVNNDNDLVILLLGLLLNCELFLMLVVHGVGAMMPMTMLTSSLT